MMKYTLASLTSICLLSVSGSAAPLAGCYELNPPGTWSELRLGGVDGAAGNTLSATDEATYSFTGATLATAEADATGEWDWITVYTNATLVLTNVSGAPWYNPYQVEDSVAVAFPEVVVLSRSTRYQTDQDPANDTHAEFVIAGESGSVSFTAAYAGEPIALPEGADLLVGDDLDMAEICVSGGKLVVRQRTINVKSRGVIPAVLLGAEGFDVRDVNPETIQLSGAPALRWVVADVNRDGFADLNLKFATQAAVEDLVAADVPDKSIATLVLTATMEDGVTTVASADDVRILNKKKKAKPAKPQKPVKPAKGNR